MYSIENYCIKKISFNISTIDARRNSRKKFHIANEITMEKNSYVYDRAAGEIWNVVEKNFHRALSDALKTIRRKVGLLFIVNFVFMRRKTTLSSHVRLCHFWKMETWKSLQFSRFYLLFCFSWDLSFVCRNASITIYAYYTCAL